MDSQSPSVPVQGDLAIPAEIHKAYLSCSGSIENTIETLDLAYELCTNVELMAQSPFALLIRLSEAMGSLVEAWDDIVIAEEKQRIAMSTPPVNVTISDPDNIQIRATDGDEQGGEA